MDESAQEAFSLARITKSPIGQSGGYLIGWEIGGYDWQFLDMLLSFDLFEQYEILKITFIDVTSLFASIDEDFHSPHPCILVGRAILFFSTLISPSDWAILWRGFQVL